MQIQFFVEYKTRWGDRLVLVAGSKRHDMAPRQGGIWTLSLDKVRSLGEYHYEVWRGEKCIRTEEVPHHVDATTGVKKLILKDRWQDRPANAPFWSTLFKDVVFARGERSPQPQEGNVTFVFPAAEVRSDLAVALTGSDWGWKQMQLMDDSAFPVWTLTLQVDKPFDYKFALVDRKTLAPVCWETGPNRFFNEVPAEGSHLLVSDIIPVFPTLPWRGAGTAVPVFSLRSEESFGVGEFHDIRLLVDWAVATGQNVIQLLPINDTTMTGTWQDSYPYNANTTFALHPQFIHLPDAGVRQDKAYKTLRDELNALPQIDYERVNGEKLRLLRKAFAKTKVLESEEYKAFYEANKGWLLPYAVFCCLRDETGTPDFSQWGKMAKYSAKKVADYAAAHQEEVNFHCFIQFHLDAQLKDAVAYAHAHGVALKGDLPIGISRTSVDAWAYPALYHLDSQAGAPPDAFSTLGQNWGFPTYNWEKMAEDDFAWWKSRMRKMSEYFDAFRIDHILGFFRIWEIPMHAVHGLLGYFNPALPYSAAELRSLGFDMEGGRFCTPLTYDWVLGEIFGDRAAEVRKRFVKNGKIVPEVATQRQVADLLSDDKDLCEKMMAWLDDVLFIEDPRHPGYYHPRISAMNTLAFRALDDHARRAFKELHDDFFYRRHNDFWKASAMRKLPSLLESTGMLTCGEDLGMIPACVPEVMERLGILSLEIQRMPKAVTEEFANPARYPYYCVCATGTHDTSTLRAWWEEDREATQRYWNTMLYSGGTAPYYCEPWVAEKIIDQHLKSPAMLCILPLQDWLSIDGTVRYQGDPSDERINIPAIPRHYWRYRMHLTLEALIAQTGLNAKLKGMIQRSARGV